MQQTLFDIDAYMGIKLPRANYRKSDGDARCKYCVNCYLSDYHGKNYYKCTLLGFSRGAGTDIRLSYVCDSFKDKRKFIE